MNNNCICLQSLIAVRANPSETAELVTQIVFGETYNNLKEEENWVQIETINDKYTGWIDKKLVVTLSNQEKDKLEKTNKLITTKALSFIKNKLNESTMPIVAGSEIYSTSENEMAIGDSKYAFNKNDLIANTSIDDFAKQFVNAPYLWGGKSYLGIDCSGLMQIIYKSQGILLPRDASEQAKIGNNISFTHEAKTGDLAFFDNADGNIIHVGMFLNEKTIIHASGWVRIDPIDHQGIYKSEESKYSHRLRIIKRIIQ